MNSADQLRSLPFPSRTPLRTSKAGGRFLVLLALGLCLASPTHLIAEPPAALSYDADVKPVFRNHCLGCHNGQDKKGDLALDTYAATMTGGASGEVVYANDVESSRLWQLVNHDDTPVMPPSGNKLPASDLERIRQWIEQGAAERPGTARTKPRKTVVEFTPQSLDDGQSAPLPNNVCRQTAASPPRPPAVAALETSPGAPLLAVTGHRQVLLYHTESRELLGVLPFPEGAPIALRFSTDGSLLLIGGGRGAHSGFVAIHRVADGQRLARVGDELDEVRTCDISPSLQHVAIGGTDKRTRVFRASDGSLAFEMAKHTDWVQTVAYDPTGQFLATADRAGGLILWEADTGREYAVLEGHKQSVTSLDWRSDGKVLASCSEDGTIRLWDPEKVKPVRSWAAHGGGATDLQFARDGRLLSTGRDKLVKHWDAAGKQVRAFDIQADIGLSVAIDASGKHIFGGDWTGQLVAWTASDGQRLGTLTLIPPSLEERIAAAVSAREAAAASVAESIAALEAAQETMSQVQQEWHTTVDAWSEIQLQAKTIEQAITELGPRLQEETPEAALTADVATLAEKIDQLNRTQAAWPQLAQPVLELWRQQKASIEECRQDWQRQVDALQQQESIVADWQRQLGAFQKQAQSLQDQVEQARTQRDAMTTQLAAASKTLQQRSVTNDAEEAVDTPEIVTAREWVAHCEKELEDAEIDVATAEAAFDFFQASYLLERPSDAQ